jgi:hypothetical protein
VIYCESGGPDHGDLLLAVHPHRTLPRFQRSARIRTAVDVRGMGEPIPTTQVADAATKSSSEVIGVEITPDEFRAWCRARKLQHTFDSLKQLAEGRRP